jgi:hypothetical protein
MQTLARENGTSSFDYRVESYVADNKTFCVYLAKDETIIRKHAAIVVFSATKMTAVNKVIDPTTAAA